MYPGNLTHLELLAEIDALAQRLESWSRTAPEWRPAATCRAIIDRLTMRLAALRVRLDSPLVVATLGGSGTGKSALINALAGAELVRTGRDRPTTIRPAVICRPGLTEKMLGIPAGEVDLVQQDLPALANLVLVDCPDPDTSEYIEARRASEEGDLPMETRRAGEERQDTSGHTDPLASASGFNMAGTTLSRLRRILPHCDVLIVTATQQKYRSARVAEELAAAAPGARLVFVQTHAQQDADIRDDWRRCLVGQIANLATDEKTANLPPDEQVADLSTSRQIRNLPHYHPGHIFFVDSLAALADVQQGREPQGEFAGLVDLLTRQFAGAAAARIRRANFLDLAAGALESCRRRLDEALPAIENLQAAVQKQRGEISSNLTAEVRRELLAARRPWENRLLGQVASRWGFSPFSLVLRIYQGMGGLVSGALLYRARTPAQLALWGGVEAARSWQRHRRNRELQQRPTQAATAGLDPTQLRRAAVVLEGYTTEAGLPKSAASLATIEAEADATGVNFAARLSRDLDDLIARQAARHTGWFVHLFYESMLLAMVVLLLFRLGKNFFYDSWWSGSHVTLGLDTYIASAFWLVLWCFVLLWLFTRRLQGGLQKAINRLAASWTDAADPSPASGYAGCPVAGLFAQLEDYCRRAADFRRDLVLLEGEVESLRSKL